MPLVISHLLYSNEDTIMFSDSDDSWTPYQTADYRSDEEGDESFTSSDSGLGYELDYTRKRKREENPEDLIGHKKKKPNDVEHDAMIVDTNPAGEMEIDLNKAQEIPKGGNTVRVPALRRTWSFYSKQPTLDNFTNWNHAQPPNTNDAYKPSIHDTVNWWDEPQETANQEVDVELEQFKEGFNFLDDEELEPNLPTGIQKQYNPKKWIAKKVPLKQWTMKNGKKQ
nr:MAG: hypothetical protein [Cressdnaviricota sp.]